jgi:hypothetical protein
VVYQPVYTSTPTARLSRCQRQFSCSGPLLRLCGTVQASFAGAMTDFPRASSFLAQTQFYAP